MPSKSKLGVQMYTVRESIKTAEGLVRALERIAAIGYRAVEASPWGPLAPAELRTVLEDQGLTLCAVHVGLDRLRDDLQSVIDMLGFFSCRHAVVSGSPSFSSAEEYERLAEDLSGAGQNLRPFGIRLSYHNHHWEFERFGGRTGFEILVEESDPQTLLFETDTYWVQQGGGDPAAWIRRLKGRTRLVHLKDMTVDQREVLMAEVGEGNLNWPAVFAACDEAGVEWYIVEQDFCRRDPFESLRISWENIRALTPGT